MNSIASGDCGVCISGYDYGDNLPEFCNTVMRRARKPRKCHECGDVIVQGQQYEYVSGKWEGRLEAFSTCLPCAEVRESLCCDGWNYGTLWEDASNSGLFDHMTTGCLSQLRTAAAKAKLVQQWREYHNLD